ncbi:MAG: hypothetical protein ACPLRM_02615 [Anaerolineae bacterium]
MAKKGKRPRRKAIQTRKPVAPAAKAEESRPVLATASTTSAKVSASTKVDLAQEYHYVLADLRKIAIIAVAMFILLFVLAFILR